MMRIHSPPFLHSIEIADPSPVLRQSGFPVFCIGPWRHRNPTEPYSKHNGKKG
jgi:hypothetical protein